MAIVTAPQSTAASLLPPGLNCFSTANGTPLSSGTVNFYIVSTLTPKAVWKDGGQVTAWSPTGAVTLGASTDPNPGCAQIYGSGAYREIVKDNLGNTIYDQLTASPALSGVAWGGVSTGSGNAQVITASEFQAIDGQAVAFLAGFTNTGATTVATANVAATAVVKDTVSGPVALTGSEIIANNVVEVIYSSFDGHFHLANLLPSGTATTNFQQFTSTGANTWTKPSVGSGSVTHLECWGAGGGGGANATAGGGGGGGYSDRWITTSSLGATETATVGTGGAVNTVGGNSTFGSLLTAYGGGGGGNGVWGGGGGGGQTSVGSTSGSSTGGAGGGPWLVAGGVTNTSNPANSPSGGGGGAAGSGNAGQAGGVGYYGGGGGGGGTAAAFIGGAGGGSVWGGGGGGGMGNSGGAAGTSVWGGAGGAVTVAGTQPGGGGGRNAAGGAGQCQATTYP